jgi:hypothetical protein
MHQVLYLYRIVILVILDKHLYGLRSQQAIELVGLERLFACLCEFFFLRGLLK